MSNAKAIVKAFTATVGLILVVGIITASAQTSQFVSMMRNARVFFADGTAAAPSITFASDPDTGFFHSLTIGNSIDVATNGSRLMRFDSSQSSEGLTLRGSAVMQWTSGNLGDSASSPDTILCRGAANVIGIGGCTSSFPAIKRNGVGLDFRLADDSGYTNVALAFVTPQSGIRLGANVVMVSTTAPTISSGFGTSPSIVSSNGTATFRVNVGTGGAATSGVIALPAASNGWNCQVQDMTNNTVTRMTASTTTTATFTAAAAWAASDILSVSCFGY
jgi:hypothetical protein